jgi:hypothetical protein
LTAALEVNGLNHLFLSCNDEAEGNSTLFQDKVSLDHDCFRKLSGEIRECRFLSDKILLLHKESLSFKDLADLLECECFFGDEFMDVFSSLEYIHLALLVQRMPFEPGTMNLLKEEFDQEWQFCSERFLNQADHAWRASLLKMSGMIAVDSAFENSYC